MMVAPPLKGGKDFTGNTGRKTANACETDATKTNVIAAAHFMSRAHFRSQSCGKKIFVGGIRIQSVIKRESKNTAPESLRSTSLFELATRFSFEI
jgi:hypothetical protein